MTNSILFQRLLELVLNLCKLGGSQRASCPGMLHTACAARRAYSYTSENCVLCDMRRVLLSQRLETQATQVGR